MEHLPIWLQWAVSLATVLSSIGVIVALVQLRISGNQFNRQLRLTEQQFKLVNQGYIQPSLECNFFTNFDLSAQQQDFMNPATLYNYILPVLSLQNVGNLPVRYMIGYFKVYFNGTAVYQTPPDVLNKPNSILYPKQDLPTLLGRVYFDNQRHNLSFQQVQDLHITCEFVVTYSDYNDNGANQKTINREAELSGIFFITKNLHDVIPTTEQQLKVNS